MDGSASLTLCIVLYMTNNEFANLVMEILHEQHPELEIVHLDDSLLINNKRLSLDNIRRNFKQQKESNDWLREHLFEIFENSLNIPEDISKYNLLPRIYHNSKIKSLCPENTPVLPFVNDTSILLVYDEPKFTTTITKEYLVKLELDLDTAYELAIFNLENYVVEIDFKVVESDKCKSVIIQQSDGYDSSRILSEKIRKKVAAILGRNYLVAIPNRDIFIAFQNQPKFLKHMDKTLNNHFNTLPYPITKDIFVVSPDGVSGLID